LIGCDLSYFDVHISFDISIIVSIEILDLLDLIVI